MSIRARITHVKDGVSRLYLSETWGHLPGAYTSRRAQAAVWLQGVGLCDCFRHTLFQQAEPGERTTTVKCGKGAYRLDWVEECGVRLVNEDAFWSFQQEPTEDSLPPPVPLPSWLELHPSWLAHLDGVKPETPTPASPLPKSRRPPRLPGRLPTAQRG